MLIVVSGAGNRLLKQATVQPKLKRTGLRLFQSLKLDLQSSGGGLHKFQHLLLVSPKRWCNGAACFTNIASTGQLLNIMNDKMTAMTKIIKLDGLLRGEMDYFLKQCDFTPDEELVYLRPRITYWLFHPLLKRTDNCLSWSGEVQGDALVVSFAGV